MEIGKEEPQQNLSHLNNPRIYSLLQKTMPQQVPFEDTRIAVIDVNLVA